MQDFLVVTSIGFVIFILGILLLRREKRLFSHANTTTAKVVTYYDYINYDGEAPQKMYTMAVEYIDNHGNLIHAKEQSGSTKEKYRIGSSISITYSLEKPDFFVIAGDQSRCNIFIGMIVVGLLMMFGLGATILMQQ